MRAKLEPCSRTADARFLRDRVLRFPFGEKKNQT
uniref:Uncharacterized protein n=1 Tax=Anguilla anguilla TaxID=7936 RepID=A0A0E9W6F1_ANGAN